MRVWVAVIAMLSVLALGAGGGRARDDGHGAHAHPVLVGKLVAKHRPAAARLDLALPDAVVLAPPVRTFARVAPRAALVVALAALVTGPGARAPPCA